MLRSSHDACGCSTQTTSTINLKRSTLHVHEGQADRPNTPSDSVGPGWNPGSSANSSDMSAGNSPSRRLGWRARDDSGLHPRGARPTRASTACSGSGDRAQRSNPRRDGLEATTILKRTPIDSGSDDSGDSADLPDNFHSNPSDRGDYHDEPTDVDPLSTNPRAQTMAIVQCRA
jgi:hypothetical protein